MEFCFPRSEAIRNINLGMNMVNFFYILAGRDWSYWYLGMAIFVLPQLPLVFEHLGIAVTRMLDRLCNQLSRLLIGQCLLDTLVEDEDRLFRKIVS